MAITITEGLAELKLIKSKIEKKKNFILANLGRQEGAKDQLAANGGTKTVINSELQSIGDLQERMVKIRSAIATANSNKVVDVCGTSRSISDWLVWRRDVAPIVKDVEQRLATGVMTLKQQAQKQGFKIVGGGEQPVLPTDVIIELDEKALADKSEKTQEILDRLDGQLSLHNATTMIEAA